jgi:hypothetical protein
LELIIRERIDEINWLSAFGKTLFQFFYNFKQCNGLLLEMLCLKRDGMYSGFLERGGDGTVLSAASTLFDDKLM